MVYTEASRKACVGWAYQHSRLPTLLQLFGFYREMGRIRENPGHPELSEPSLVVLIGGEV